MNDIEKELNIQELRARFLRYTREAFKKLPAMKDARVLDIGCGSGISMFELARLCDYEILGIDVDENAITDLQRRIESKGLADRMKVMALSLPETDFPDESFDILWEEGTLHILDTDRGLFACSRLLKPNGFLVVGEAIEWFENAKASFSRFGFDLVETVLWPKGCWWTDYYSPLEKRLASLRQKSGASRDIAALDRFEDEIAMVKKDLSKTDCGHFIMRKQDKATAK